MHPTLQYPDILAQIVEFVLVLSPLPRYDPMGFHEYDYNPTLAALARTCKLFMEPSLNALWRSLTTMGPLMKTLPLSVWEDRVAACDAQFKPVAWVVVSTTSQWHACTFTDGHYAEHS